jgi:hypothetical protein
LVLTLTSVPPPPTGDSANVTTPVAPPRPLESVPWPLRRARCATASISSNRAVPTKDKATGPRRTDTLPLNVPSSMTSSNSAPGMQGAILRMSSRIFHVSSTGSATVKLFLMSMAILTGRLPAGIADSTA